MAEDFAATSAIRSPWASLAELGRMVSYVFTPAHRRVQHYYEMFGAGSLLTESTGYINLGYWTPGCTKMDDACRGMAEMLAQTAKFQEGDRILDVGFGYGDQDLYWLDEYKPESITGINITPLHVETAMQRVRERGLEGQLDLRLGSATDMEFADGSFDKVVALESAFHFDTREQFLQNAYRVLKSGGVFAAADCAYDGKDEAGGKPRKQSQVSRRLRREAIPEANWYTIEKYREILTSIGFVDIETNCISDHVFRPLAEHLVTKLDDPEFKRRASPFFCSMLKQRVRKGEAERVDYDYYLVRARKP
jgi:erythromycin 3''-O-methyltransferase